MKSKSKVLFWVIFILAFLTCLLLIFNIINPNLVLTISADASKTKGSGGYGSGSGSGIPQPRPDTPRCNPPNNGVICGEDCCLPGETCYPAGKNIWGISYPAVCCPEGYVGENSFGLAWCRKKCDKKTEIECGETCCIKSKEQCKTQASGKHGVCLPLGENCPSGTYPCPNSDENWKNVKACCEVNQECVKEVITAPMPLGTTTEIEVWGCSVNENKGCPEGSVLCKGKGRFEKYIICCKEGETCENNINGGQPYCYKKGSSTTSTQTTSQKLSIFQRLMNLG